MHLKAETRSHHQMERVDGSRAGSRLKGDAVEMICLRYNTYGICLPGHVTTRSRPTVPSSPLLLTTSSSLQHKDELKRKKDENLKKALAGYLKKM